MAATGPSIPPTLALLLVLLLGLLSGGPGRRHVGVVAVPDDPGEAGEAEGEGASAAPVLSIDVGLPSPPEDLEEGCPGRAAGGECARNRPYMLERCAVSCKVRRGGERVCREECRGRIG